MNNFYLRFNPLIWENGDLSIEKKLIINFVWNFCIKSGYAYSSNDYIAQVFGMRVTDVKTLIAELLEEEHIKTIPHPERRLLIVNTKLYPIEE